MSRPLPLLTENAGSVCTSTKSEANFSRKKLRKTEIHKVNENRGITVFEKLKAKHTK